MPKIIPIENIEDTRNRVDSLEGELSSEQYPTAQAVKDYIDKLFNLLQGNN